MKRICTIAVRAGSKGFPGKNWRDLLGLPLFAHSIIAAQESGQFSAIVVTSDAAQVLDSASGFGATHVLRRPADLCTDESGKIPAISHAVKSVEDILGIEFDTIVDLDATSPLRINHDIVEAIRALESKRVSSVVTGTESRRSPYFNLIEHDESLNQWGPAKRLGREFLRRQDVPKTIDMNASIYVWDRHAFTRDPKVFYPSTELYEMPPERSIDIDSELDFEIVSCLMNRRTHGESLQQ